MKKLRILIVLICSFNGCIQSGQEDPKAAYYPENYTICETGSLNTIDGVGEPKAVLRKWTLLWKGKPPRSNQELFTLAGRKIRYNKQFKIVIKDGYLNNFCKKEERIKDLALFELMVAMLREQKGIQEVIIEKEVKEVTFKQELSYGSGGYRVKDIKE